MSLRKVIFTVKSKKLLWSINIPHQYILSSACLNSHCYKRRCSYSIIFESDSPWIIVLQPSLAFLSNSFIIPSDSVMLTQLHLSWILLRTHKSRMWCSLCSPGDVFPPKQCREQISQAFSCCKAELSSEAPCMNCREQTGFTLKLILGALPYQCSWRAITSAVT